MAKPKRAESTFKPSTQFASFPDTVWSSVWKTEDDPAVRRRRLAKLARRYWNPVYTVVRHFGCQDADAKDVTQAFFTGLAENAVLDRYDPSRGRFRTFLRVELLNSLQQQRRDRRKRDHALAKHAAREARKADATRDPRGTRDPGTAFDRAWISELLDHATEEARSILDARGFPRAVDLHLQCPHREPRPATLRALARKLGIDEAGAANQLFMARNLIREIMIDDIRQTVSRPEDLDDELQFVFGPTA